MIVVFENPNVGVQKLRQGICLNFVKSACVCCKPMPHGINIIVRRNYGSMCGKFWTKWYTILYVYIHKVVICQQKVITKIDGQLLTWYGQSLSMTKKVCY